MSSRGWRTPASSPDCRSRYRPTVGMPRSSLTTNAMGAWTRDAAPSVRRIRAGCRRWKTGFNPPECKPVLPGS